MAIFKQIRFLILTIVLLITSGVGVLGAPVSREQTSIQGLSKRELKCVEDYVRKQMHAGKIPGLALVIVKGDRIMYQKGFGFADLEQKKPVTGATLFELGSTSKAFTGLGILHLKEQGKISLDDPVAQYLPWFQMKYHGRYARITIRQLLHQTSGIPFKTIDAIPVADGLDALEKTVRTLIGKELDHPPGESFLYATINYDVLGLVIAKVSGESYEKYIRDNIILPLGLNTTFLERWETSTENFATGYKMAFLHPVKYRAPAYRGNTPAGYIMTNARDLTRWLQIQMGLVPNLPPLYRSLIEESHSPDRSVPPTAEGSSYAIGWNIYQRGSGEISHGGSNPNYSSYIIFRPQDKVGVGILANLNSSYTQAAGDGVLRILQRKKLAEPTKDLYRGIDQFASTTIFTLTPVILINIWILLVLLRESIQKKTDLPEKKIASLY